MAAHPMALPADCARLFLPHKCMSRSLIALIGLSTLYRVDLRTDVNMVVGLIRFPICTCAIPAIPSPAT